jgi:hypothetical protein
MRFEALTGAKVSIVVLCVVTLRCLTLSNVSEERTATWTELVTWPYGVTNRAVVEPELSRARLGAALSVLFLKK